MAAIDSNSNLVEHINTINMKQHYPSELAGVIDGVCAECNDNRLSEVQRFFSGKNVMITGATDCVTVTMDIKLVDHGRELKCESSRVNLVVGEEFQLVAKLPNIADTVAYMLCYNATNSVASRCTQTRAQCFSNRTIFSTRQQDTWNCTYHMNTTRPVGPFKPYMGKNYTSPTCVLNITAVGPQTPPLKDYTPRFPSRDITSTTMTTRSRTTLPTTPRTKLPTDSTKDRTATVAPVQSEESLKKRLIALFNSSGTQKQVSGEQPKLEIRGISLKPSDVSNGTYLLYSFSEPKNISMKCIFNKLEYVVTLFDGDKDVTKVMGNSNKGNTKLEKNILPYNFTLDSSDKALLCQATEKQSAKKPRIFKIKVDFKYEPEYRTTALIPTTKDPETTTRPEKGEANAQSFWEHYWLIIVICCIVLTTICVVAGCIKILCARKPSQPPDDYVNLTSDRGNGCPAQTAPIRTMPKMESNYCNPKDIQGRKNNIEPNYSEAKEAQIMCEGLYAELNRPENTYAEPYINKNELYARPIPKAERPKKDDPNYGNVFGQDYVNSRK